MKVIKIDANLSYGEMFDKIRRILKVSEIVKVNENEYWMKVRIHKRHDFSSMIKTELQSATYIVQRI